MEGSNVRLEWMTRMEDSKGILQTEHSKGRHEKMIRERHLKRKTSKWIYERETKTSTRDLAALSAIHCSNRLASFVFIRDDYSSFDTHPLDAGEFTG